MVNSPATNQTHDQSLSSNVTFDVLIESFSQESSFPAAFTQSMCTGSGYYFGAMVAGPVGALVGGIAGTLIGYMISPKYDNIVAEMRRLDPNQQRELLQRVLQFFYSLYAEPFQSGSGAQGSNTQNSRDAFTAFVRQQPQQVAEICLEFLQE